MNDPIIREDQKLFHIGCLRPTLAISDALDLGMQPGFIKSSLGDSHMQLTVRAR